MRFDPSFLCALIVCAVLSPNLSAGVAIPESRVGRVLQQFLDAFNSGERPRLEAFFETYGPDWVPEVGGLAEMQAPTGGVDVAYIGKHDSNFMEWIEQTRKDDREFMGMMEITDEDPIRIAHLRYVQVEGGSKPGSFAVDAQSRRAVVESVSAGLDKTYVFPKVAKEMIKVIRGNLRGGRYDSLSNGVEFSEALTKDLRSVSRDKHLV